jgi:hypothetical protein
MSGQQYFDALPQFGIAAAFAVEKAGSLAGVGQFDRGGEDGLYTLWVGGHGRLRTESSPPYQA